MFDPATTAAPQESSLDTARMETQNAITAVAAKLADARAFIVSKESELAEAISAHAALGIQHTALVAMFEAGKIVNAVEGAVERAVPTLEKDAAAIGREVASIAVSPWAKRIGTWGPWAAVGLVVVYGAGHFVLGWPL